MPLEFNNASNEEAKASENTRREEAREERRDERRERRGSDEAREERRREREKSRRNTEETMRSIHTRIGRKFTTGRVNETLEKIVEHANKAFDNWVGQGVINAYVLDAKTYDLHFSAIVLATTVEVEGANDKTLVMPLIFEDDRNPLRPRAARRYSGQDVEVQPVPSDVYDANYFDAITQLLVSKGMPSELVNVGHQIIPAKFEIKEPSDFDTVLGEAVVNLQSYGFYEAGVLTHTLTPDEISPDMEVIANVDYRSEQTADIVGQPIVAPITIEIAEQAINTGRNQQQSYNGNGGAARQLLEVSLTVNFAYVEPERDSVKCFIPQIIVTAIQSSELMPSLELVLYGLSSTSIVLNGYRWTEAFLPSIARHAPHRNIGALAIDAPEDDQEFGEPMDITAVSFNDKKFNRYVNSLIESYTSIAIDAPEQGVGAYLTESFYLAAAEYAGEEDENKDPITGGIDRIVDASNNATGGAFDRFWDGAPIVSQSVTRIHNGFYLDESNSPRDIREIDYLYLLNIGTQASAIERARDFDDSYTRGGPIGQRDRCAIINEVTGDNATYTGYSRRVVLNPRFVEALSRAFDDQGLGINPSNIGNYNRGAGRRKISSFGQFLASSDEFNDVYRQRSRRDRDRDFDEGSRRFNGGRGRW